MTRFLSGLARLRRGPWEMVASIAIGLGVVMLMQPFWLAALPITYSLNQPMSHHSLQSEAGGQASVDARAGSSKVYDMRSEEEKVSELKAAVCTKKESSDPRGVR